MADIDSLLGALGTEFLGVNCNVLAADWLIEDEEPLIFCSSGSLEGVTGTDEAGLLDRGILLVSD